MREGGGRSTERGRVEINKQIKSTSGLHQSKNGMGTFIIQNSSIHIIAKHVYYSSVRYTTEHTLAEQHLNGAMMRF